MDRRAVTLLACCVVLLFVSVDFAANNNPADTSPKWFEVQASNGAPTVAINHEDWRAIAGYSDVEKRGFIELTHRMKTSDDDFHLGVPERVRMAQLQSGEIIAFGGDFYRLVSFSHNPNARSPAVRFERVDNIAISKTDRPLGASFLCPIGGAIEIADGGIYIDSVSFNGNEPIATVTTVGSGNYLYRDSRWKGRKLKSGDIVYSVGRATIRVRRIVPPSNELQHHGWIEFTPVAIKPISTIPSLPDAPEDN